MPRPCSSTRAALVALLLTAAALTGCSSDDADDEGENAAPDATTTSTTMPMSTFTPITGGTDEDGDPLPPPVHASVSVVVLGDTTWSPYAGIELTGLDTEAAAAVAMRVRQIDEALTTAGIDGSFEFSYGNAAALCDQDPDIFDELELHGHEVSAHARTKGETFRVVRALDLCGISPTTVSGLAAIADPVGTDTTTLDTLDDAMAVLSIQDLHSVVGPVRSLCQSLGLWAPTNNYGTGADTAPWRSAWRDGEPCADAGDRPIVMIDQLPVAPGQDEERLGPDSFSNARTRMTQTLGWAADLRYRSADELPAPGMLTWGLTMRLDDLIAPVPDETDETDDEASADETTDTTAEIVAGPPPDPRTAPLGAETLTAMTEWFAEWQPDVDQGRLVWLTPRSIAETLRGT